ncbi:GntR family transcriptional regulator [soil metagenome]
MSPALRELTSETLADQAYVALRRAILDGELERGQKVTERGLAALLSISATPVREAIRRLEQDRLVERTGSRSLRVAEVSDRAVLEVGLIEGTLRALAARLAATNAAEGQIARMGKALDDADAAVAQITTAVAAGEADDAMVRRQAEKALACVRQFHDLVDRACGNDLLLHLLSTAEAFTYSDRVEALHDQIATRRDQGPTARFADHRSIYEAIVARDPDRAESLMRAHAREGAAAVAATTES